MTASGERSGTQADSGVRVLVTSGFGVTVLDVAGDSVERYALVEDCTALDVTRVGSRVAVATPDDVLVGDGSEFEESGFGPAVAVGGDPLLAADPSGNLSRLGVEWESIGSLDTNVTAIDGDLVGTEDGVFRVVDGDVEHVGLSDVTDVAAGGIPHAATEDGLYKLGAGWMRVLEGSFTLVAAASESEETLRRAHAATAEELFQFDGEDWTRWHIPVDSPVAGIDYGESVYAVFEEGTMITVADGEWRTRSLGLRDVTGLLVMAGQEDRS
ncbi:MAG: hypothetical protein ABEJ58_03435 [Halodesulfurarchaeum sp.]